MLLLQGSSSEGGADDVSASRSSASTDVATVNSSRDILSSSLIGSHGQGK